VPRPWAQTYGDDPVTNYLLSRGVTIGHHESLHTAANGFLDGPFKQSLGQANTEALGMHHYTVHVKLGIAREYLDDLKSKLNSNQFNLMIDPSFTFHKFLAGFFVNLTACFDNLAQELSLVYDLGLDERDDMQDVMQLVARSQNRLQANRSLPRDAKLASVISIIQSGQSKMNEIQRYRNHLAHRKLVNSMISVSASAPAMPLKWYQLQSIPPPSSSSFPLPSGSFAQILPSGAAISNQSGQQITVHVTSFTSPNPAKFYLPRPDKLDLLPTQLNYPYDLDDRDIGTVCEEFYNWTVDFLGRIYEVIVSDFQKLT
jgi:hypothetical protein